MLSLHHLIFALFSITLTNCKNLPEIHPNTAIISKYAKVANFGVQIHSASTAPTTRSEARSSGQSLWSHRSDVNIVSGQSLKSTSKPSVVYHYAINKKTGNYQEDSTPGVGEVQERFNPRPYFDYAHVPSKYSPPKADKASAGGSPAPFDSFPSFSQPPAPPSAPAPSYDSGYSSYNPPKSGPVSPPSDDSSQIPYPPNSPPFDDSDAPPDAPPPDKPMPPPDKPMPPPKDENVFYPPSEADKGHKEIILDHPPPGWEEPKMKDMAEHDLAPPPSPPAPSYQNDDSSARFPQYLYSDPNGHHDHDHGFDFDHHHVYKEVTTTEAPEVKRVNNEHYSYYYLGRKLYYVPLYFSVYFVVYVTALILKSIARHKIQFKHDHFQRGARKMDDQQLDKIHANVTTAIDATRAKFPYIAM